MAKILIVEDDEILIKMYQKKLANKAYDVVLAKDGSEGLKTALSEKPDLILLDIKMPNMDGLQMLKLLRKNEWGKEVPVIILTNLEADEKITWDVSETMPAYYLLKASNRPEMVVEKVKEVLEGKIEE
jgi:CheY-like chemotaxis protein